MGRSVPNDGKPSAVYTSRLYVAVETAGTTAQFLTVAVVENTDDPVPAATLTSNATVSSVPDEELNAHGPSWYAATGAGATAA